MIYDMIIHKWKPEHFYKVRPKSCVLMVNHITFYKSTLSHKIKDEFLRVVNHWKIFTFVSIGPINLQSLIHQHTISVPLKVVLWVFIKTRLQHSFLRREQKTIKWLEWSIKSTSQVTARERDPLFSLRFYVSWTFTVHVFGTFKDLFDDKESRSEEWTDNWIKTDSKNQGSFIQMYMMEIEILNCI